MMTVAYRRRLDGVVTLCEPDPSAPPLVVCRGMEPTDRERDSAAVQLMIRQRQVRLFEGAP